MLVLSTSAERDLVLLISYLCCFQRGREGIARKLAEYLEFDPLRNDLAKVEGVVDAEFNALSAFYRNLANKLRNISEHPEFTDMDKATAVIGWLDREILAARARRMEVRGF